MKDVWRRTVLALGLWAAWLGMAAAGASGAPVWQRLGPAGGMVMALEGAPGGTIFLGTADGHVFASGDDGRHWELRGRVGTRTDAVVSRLLYDTKGSQELLAAVWFQEPGAGGGVFRSRDEGRTWQRLGLEKEAVRALEQAPSDSKEFVAGTRTGVFRSRDGGATWEQISPPGDAEIRNVDSIAIDPRNPDQIYAGTYHLPWKTSDGGKNWKSITTGLIDDSDIMSMRIDAAQPQRVYLSACSGIYRSEDEGAQWTKLQGIPYASRRTQAIVQDAKEPGTLYAGTTEGLWVTRDNGESWKRTTPPGWVINSVLVQSGAAGRERVLVGTEGQGVEASEDAGESFAASNDGFKHQVIRQLVQDPADANHLLIVMESGGTRLLESADGGQTWKELPHALEVKAAGGTLSAETLVKVYGSEWGWLALHRDGQVSVEEKASGEWKEWKPRVAHVVRAAKGGGAHATKRMEAVRVEGELVAMAGESAFVVSKYGVLRCDAKGNCEELKEFAKLKDAQALAVSRDGAQLVVAGTDFVAHSADGGKSVKWESVPGGEPGTLWMDIGTNGTLWMGTNRGIFSWTDGADSWAPVRGLPEGQLERWLRGRTHWFAGLRQGQMYVSNDEGKSWTRIDEDAERSRVSGVAERGDGGLVVGTESEGVLEWGGQVPK